MAGKINIGTSGFRTNKAAYAKILRSVEIQHTFYQPPQIKTLERWRAEVPADFEFAIKAWQIITHEAKSPTYKRLKKNLSEAEKSEAGFFKPTSVVREAWDVTLACAEALKAKIVLFQCPASFRQTDENVTNLARFFKSIKRGKLEFAWEPRGDWNRDLIKNICADLKLRHAVDPFKDKTATPARIYFRLHGRTGWRYKYEAGELEDLSLLMPKNKTSYVFFNNIYMTEDAVKFQEIVKENEIA